MQGGFVAALLWMTPCTFIALGQLNYFQQQLRKSEEGEQLPVAQAPNGTGSFGKEPTAAPAAVDPPPVRSASRADSAAAAGDVPGPPQLHTLGEVKASPQGVVPVADANGTDSGRY